jgi:hypothetical protein
LPALAALPVITHLPFQKRHGRIMSPRSIEN